jgi:type IV secretion system protein VirB11
MRELQARDEERRRLLDQIRGSLGPDVGEALIDPRVMNVLVNADGRLWLDTYERGMYDTGITLPPLQVEAALSVIASALGEEINARRPILEGELPDGSRIEGWVPLVSEAPAFSIRKHHPLIPFAEYLAQGIVDARQADGLRAAILARQNILIVGGAGSGKTTFASAVLDEMARLLPPSERFIILEDTRELRVSAVNRLALRTKRAATQWNRERPEEQSVTLNDLVRSALRTPIGRLIVGEVRGGAETAEMLEAWGTGHPGLATLHAPSPQAAFTRLEILVRKAGMHPDPYFLAQVVNVVVVISRTGPRSWRVTEVVKVAGYDAVEGYVFNQL